jgi:RHS repeat-associated protein
MMKNIVLAFLLSAEAVAAVNAQVSNKPGTATQVTGPSIGVAATPSGYLVGGQATLVNFICERDAMGRITDTIYYASAGYVDVKQTTSFFDGLGRTSQTVVRQLTPGSSPQDVVTPVVYDAFGRETYKYLLYVSQSSEGGFKLDPFNEQKNFYQNVYPAEQPAYTGEQVYYGQTVFELSPLNRVTKAMAAGNSWAGSGNGVGQQYLVNSDADSVVIWNIANDTLTYVNGDISTNIPTAAGYYSIGQLFKNVTIDEQGHGLVEYKDKDGLVILKKVQVTTTASDFSGYSGWLSTYYVYDKRSQLRFVLSPKATGIAFSNGWNLSADTTSISQLCFRYEYDGRRRMTAKKVAGTGWTYMVYDARDRLVFSQDANMRRRNQWMTTLYDVLNRVTIAGMTTFSGLPNQLQAYVSASTGGGVPSTVPVNGTTPGGLLSELDISVLTNGDQKATSLVELQNGFDTPDTVDFTAEIDSSGVAGQPFSDTVSVVDNPIPSGSNFIPLTLSFYDDYSGTADKQYTTVYNSLLDAGTNQHVETLPNVLDQQAVQTIGMATGIKVRVIEDPNDLTKGAWLASVPYYDDRGRLIQTQSDNYKGGRDTVVSLYNFTGQVIASYQAHSNPQAGSGVAGNTHVKTNLNFDHANRLLEVYKTINDADSTRRLIASHSYDQMGQLKQKQLGQLPDQSFLETQDYAYTIRGWLKGINRDYASNDNSHGANNRWFGMDLSYDWGFGTNFLNGNISGNKWRSKGDGQQRAYGFGYDAVNRLLFADFNQYSGSGWDKSAKLDFTTIMGNGVDPTTAYDENGNIRFMQQQGWQLGGSHLIDSLAYTYGASSNKLQNVIDGDNDPNTKLGDFRTSSLSPYSTGKTTAAVDYTYDDNGNMVRDLNKDIGSLTADGIVYNHLNLPWQVTVRSATGTKGTITYIYDATGTKLEKKVVDSAGAIQTLTTYISGFQYQGRAGLAASGPADTLQFFAHEEGRVRVVPDTVAGHQPISFKYDYFLKDHLGNTRMVLTDEQETDKYVAATMEVGDSAQENLYYSGLDETRTSLPAGYPTDTTTNPNNYVARLNGGASGPKIGPGIVLKVMAGDQFSIKASSWYRLNGTSPGTPTSPLTDLVTALISGIGGLPGGGHPSPALMQANQAPISSNFSQFLQDTGAAIVQGKPHAFVNWVLFDNQFNYVAASSGFQQVGSDQELKPHILLNLPVTASGYLYIYTSNETPNVDVYFDNLQVTHTRGPLVEENHYYPFGLTMAGISDKAINGQYVENKFRYNGIDFNTDFQLYEYDAYYRNLDPQTGRFWQVDPKAAFGLGTYLSMGDNPISNKDWLGDVFSFASDVIQERYKNLRKTNNSLIMDEALKLGSLDLNSKDKDVQKEIDQLTNLINRRADFNSQLDEMEGSSLVFNLNDNPNEDPKDRRVGQTSYNYSTGQVDVNLGGHSDRMDVMAHEIRHGFGFLVGEESMSKLGDILYDKTDEVVAYQTGFLFTEKEKDVANGIITLKWLNHWIATDQAVNIAYGRLPDEPLSINTPASILAKYVSLPYEKDFISKNSANSNLKAIDVMKATNSYYSHGPGRPLYNLPPVVKTSM